MSSSKEITITCSQCGKLFRLTQFEHIDTEDMPDVEMQIISGELFTVKCPHCKTVEFLNYDLVYEDKKHSAIIYVLNPGLSEYINKYLMLRVQPVPLYNIIRTVDNVEELMEKVSCITCDRDDRIIELCKIYYMKKFHSAMPDTEIQNMFFKFEKIYIIDNKDNSVCYELSDNIYNYFKNLYFNSPYAQKFNYKYPKIDSNWAEDMIKNLALIEPKNADAVVQSGSLSIMDDFLQGAVMTCPKCKNVIPKDSVFCQMCGINLSESDIQEQDVITEDSEHLLSATEIMSIKGNNPILIENVCLYSSDDRKMNFLCCRFRSLSNKMITALLLDIRCFDVWGNELERMQNVQILDLKAKRDDVFGETEKIPLVAMNTRSVKVELKRIKYSNGIIEDCIGEEYILPAPVKLISYFNSQELVQQYIYETSEHSVLVPQKVGEYWVCSCGRINSENETKCSLCGVDEDSIFESLNFDHLRCNQASRIQKSIAQDNRLKQARDDRADAKLKNAFDARQDSIENTRSSKKRKKIALIVVISIIVAISITLSIIKSIYNAQLRNYATEEMNADFSNVYADLTIMEPMYFIYQYKYDVYDNPRNVKLESVVCKCLSVENIRFWIVVPIQSYPGAYGSDNEEDYLPFETDKYNPIRITGKVDTAGQVLDELEDEIGDILVLCVQDISINEYTY